MPDGPVPQCVGDVDRPHDRIGEDEPGSQADPRPILDGHGRDADQGGEEATESQAVGHELTRRVASREGLVNHSVGAKSGGRAERQQISRPRSREGVPRPQEHRHPEKPHHHSHGFEPGRRPPASQPHEDHREDGVSGDQDRAGESRGSVEPEDEPHLVEEEPGQTGCNQRRKVRAPRVDEVPRRDQHGRGEREHGGEPHCGEGDGVDVPPGDLEQGERRGPHQCHGEKGKVDQEWGRVASVLLFHAPRGPIRAFLELG